MNKVPIKPAQTLAELIKVLEEAAQEYGSNVRWYGTGDEYLVISDGFIKDLMFICPHN